MKDLEQQIECFGAQEPFLIITGEMIDNSAS